ncbi:unnamed protein product [Paramecium sonneborni]|uniref:Transmembrane protein n=1 Tax=Paramecium sonneborni TaxID=65129 RepID=A0A8S1NLT9_9CILI|nr:unnamed protein product [Paramecium sonneborni]
MLFKWNNLYGYNYYQKFIVASTALRISTCLILLLVITMVENCLLKHKPQIHSKKNNFIQVHQYFGFYLNLSINHYSFFLIITLCQFYKNDNTYSIFKIEYDLKSFIYFFKSYKFITNKFLIQFKQIMNKKLQ